MASFNKVILMGNLTRDPDVRATGTSGMKVARLGLAVNERRRDKSGQMQDFPVFVDVDAWDKHGKKTALSTRSSRCVPTRSSSSRRATGLPARPRRPRFRRWLLPRAIPTTFRSKQ